MDVAKNIVRLAVENYSNRRPDLKHDRHPLSALVLLCGRSWKSCVKMLLPFADITLISYNKT